MFCFFCSFLITLSRHQHCNTGTTNIVMDCISIPPKVGIAIGTMISAPFPVGTRKAARNEATEMSRMAYEQFREARNNLFYEVKSQWYQLCNLNEQYKNTQANLALLEQLEKLALNRYSVFVSSCLWNLFQ